MKEQISDDNKLLKRIKVKLDELLSDSLKPDEILSHALYQLIRKDKELKVVFPSRLDFNKFLLNQHKKGKLYKVIGNYRIVSSLPNQYKWYFFKENESASADFENSSPFLYGNFTYSENKNSFIASNGEQLRNQVEVDIYEKLIFHSDLFVLCDYPTSMDGKMNAVNFYVGNTRKNQTFLWEHYDGKREEEFAIKKRDWYKQKGYNSIENKGEVIFTYADNENEIDKFLSLILDSQA